MKKPIAGLALALAASLAFAVPASAHVSVNPKTAEQGGYAKLTFRVPNEKEAANTTKVEVNIPTDKPIASVSVEPEPGWTYTVEKSKLATPIKSDDGDQTEAISKLTWTADAAGVIKPGEFREFNISAGPLPADATSVQFKALQTYSDGEVVRWIDDVAANPDASRPAPTLTLTPKSTTTTTAPGSSSSASTDAEEDDDSNTLAIVALVIGVLGLGVGATALFARKKG